MTRRLIAMATVIGIALIAAPAASTAAGLRTPMQGLLDRTGKAADPSGVVNGIVANARWADLQSSESGGITHPNAIDAALKTARTWKAEHPSGPEMSVKIRLLAGIHAPRWAKSLDGEPIPYPNPDSTQSIGRFWTADFRDAYEDLQKELVDEYGDEPEIREVTIYRCTTIYAEPFIRQMSDLNAAKALIGNGYTSEQDEQCQKDQVEAHQTWDGTGIRHTLAFNPYQRVDGDRDTDGNVTNVVRKVDVAFTEKMMETCRDILESACVLGNNSIRASSMGSAYDRMYDEIEDHGPPIYFQTAAAANLDDLKKTLDWAIRQGANSVELPSNYTSLISGKKLAVWDARLEANPIGS